MAANPSQRIKGQEVSVLISRDNVLEDTLVDIQNFNSEDELEIKSMGYLGEKSNRKDEVYNGTKLDFEMNIHRAAYFQFRRAILDRAQRNNPNIRFDVTIVSSFPNGETEVETFPDVKFGPIPRNIPARGDYVKIKLSGEVQGTTEVQE
jgi:hypothetical protein